MIANVATVNPAEMADERPSAEPQRAEPSAGLPRVLLYYPDFGAMGGIERYILQTAYVVQARGKFQPVVVCSEGTPFHQALQQAGIPVFGVQTKPAFEKPFWRFLDRDTQRQLKLILDQVQPALVHVHIGQCENLFFKQLGYPLIYSVHGYSTLYSLSETKNPLKRLAKKICQPLFTMQLPKLDAMLFVSRSERERMYREGYLNDLDYGEILPNGAPIKELQYRVTETDRTAYRQQLGIPADAQVVSYINRLDDNKNPRLFLALVDRLVNEPIKRNLHFIIAGGGPLEDEIIAQVQALSYAERIHVLGHRRDVPELLACSDLTVSVAAMEGFGLGVLEAMAAGVPPVCYAAGGIPELIPPTDTDALLAAVGDFEGLVGRIGKLLRLSEAERRKMSERLRKQAARYEMMDCIERLEEVYGRVIGQA